MENLENGCSLIAKERDRQINELGYDVKHDNLYSNQQLSTAGAIYALSDTDKKFLVEEVGVDAIKVFWPGDEKYWKPTPDDRIRELTKAGALIAAQIDRLLYEKEQLNKQ